MKRIEAVRGPAGFAVVALLAAALGCDPAPSVRGATNATVDTVGGVIVVHNHGTDAEAAPRYSVQEIWRAGGLSAPPASQFTGPEMVTSFGPDGDAFVLDKAQAEIAVLDAETGTVTRRFGGHGLGPGELSSPGGMAWGPKGRLWVANSFNGRYTVFDEAGELIETLPRLRGGVNRSPFPMVSGADGTLLDHLRGYPHVVFVRVDERGSVVDSLRVRHPEVDLFGGGILADGLVPVMWMRPYLLWDFEVDASAIWTMRSDSMTLVKLSIGGDTLRRVISQHRQPAFTPTQRDAIARANRLLGREGGFTPVIARSLHLLQNGRILVQIATDNDPSDVVDVSSAEFDMFDPDGRWMGTLSTPFPVHRLSIIASRGDTVLLPMLGELDVPIIVKGLLVDAR